MRNAILRVLCLATLVALTGCGGKEQSEEARKQQAEFEKQIQAKYNMSYNDMPVVELKILSPHNQDIEHEFERAFSQTYALKHGQRVDVVFPDVGGGGSKMLTYLRNVYSRSETSGYDMLWGGGDDVFTQLAEEGLLQAVELPASYKENVPQQFGGLAMYDSQGRWAGAAISGFGILYNKPLLNQEHLPYPTLWDNLADPKYYNCIAVADPMQSSSAAAACKMIVQSGGTWPAGWAKLMGVIGNARRFYDGASGAADAVIAEAPIATCIDFYGAMRVMKYPDRLVYLSPKGQTVFNADPIGILKNPEHPDLAKEFLDFVLSPRGQALWSLRVGTPDGPVENALYRSAIRKDVYSLYRDSLLPGMANPFEEGNEMAISPELQKIDFSVLRRLIHAASIANAEGLKKARKAVIDAGMPTDKVALFNELPPNIRTIQQMQGVADRLGNDVEAEKIATGWQQFFAEKYRRLTE